MNDTELSAGPSSYEVVGLPVGFPDVLGEAATSGNGGRAQSDDAAAGVDAETEHACLLELTAKIWFRECARRRTGDRSRPSKRSGHDVVGLLVGFPDEFREPAAGEMRYGAQGEGADAESGHISLL